MYNTSLSVENPVAGPNKNQPAPITPIRRRITIAQTTFFIGFKVNKKPCLSGQGFQL
jgi:hypothetical protein